MPKNNFKIPQMEPYFDKAEAQAVFAYMKSGGWITEFKKTEELENAIKKFVGAKHAVMTVNGTVSLTLALLALGLKPGDEVLVPNMTMIASPNSAVKVGIKPILVDIEAKTLCMDLEKAAKAISPKTKALMYVPFNGRCADMNEVVKFCANNNIFLIEDAAQALGSFYKNKHLGSFGKIGSFSFSTPKIITTGQGGALVTNDGDLHQKIKRLKDFGRAKGGNDIHDDWGWNFKFTDLQAVVGIEQMKKLQARIKRKKAIYSRYQESLSNLKTIEFIPTNLKDTTPWFIDIYVKEPDRLADYLKKKGIGTRRIYPAINTQKIYQHECKNKLFPISEDYARRGLWLPSSTKLSDKDIDGITASIKNFYL
ncbi:aminotransferase [Candidatus Azambacteria bacterium RIFCSPHIGHO2_01_FULL_44_55]|uniref:Aminotransferase n=1 Tax=Candidatus Azambacteria bacterium RIFCSPLOWO2_02_FULL_44_14 TaxID=1797306 RepID=A0A1F5CD35_9BACT|nr:MAG: aminotransferase [Candidatus Azambacteria bacterium RIFCSPHIGHO2_02_FULL_45_18]OGD40445.1 MAG: aminotransferase [Candidatus Azambacteria bacterium RIFCSPHIGHO2_01_FULL_44_55]OGD40778.1 MAG: aminotransferase [Candidatus Azambacteria bacterium RIFCSPLOWO2_02_FULL_44_14]OGD52305.1 MAG: aminotransferase [Candidatus Azambacteria bacterium RIFOXYD1_FULL_44_10]